MDQTCLFEASLTRDMNSFKHFSGPKYKTLGICLDRRYLITKEEMESYCKGEKYEEDSVNDDLESLFENIRLGKEPDEEVVTYFLPKLTKKELELVKTRDTTYAQTFWTSNPDVDESVMKRSKSDSKYVQSWFYRKTTLV